RSERGGLNVRVRLALPAVASVSVGATGRLAKLASLLQSKLLPATHMATPCEIQPSLIILSRMFVHAVKRWFGAPLRAALYRRYTGVVSDEQVTPTGGSAKNA